ncbi:MAG: class I SAM-dependent methyltransferase, partial [Haloarculaceae archaeon]
GSGLSRYRDCLGSLGAAPCEAAADGRTRLLHAGVSETRPTVTYVEPSRFAATVDGVSLELVSDPGLFSAGRLDDGTGLLAESVDPADDARVLDLCCGYGPIGAAVGRATGATVTLSDDDARATQCARRTLAASGVDATVVTADGVEGVRGQTFDRVLCNPPTHAGGGVLGDLFDGAADVLAPDGRLTFVRHRRLDLAGHLDRFRRVERVVKGPEHVVREARL